MKLILNCKDVAKYLDIPVSTVMYLVRENKIPHFRVGKHVRFKSEEIYELKFLKKGV